MKPFLGIDITNDKNNEKLNGDEFITATVSDELSEALDVSTDEAIGLVDKAKLPLPLRIIQYVTGLAVLMIAAGILKADVSILEGYHNAPVLYWIGAVCLPIWLVIFIASMIKSKKVLETDESVNINNHLESVSEMISDELGVPKDSPEVDIIHFSYKVKDGEIAVKNSAMEMTAYHNLIFNLYTTDTVLNIANLEHRYSIPLSSLKRITRVKKRISLSDWNKETEPTKGEYKEYKLTQDKYDCVHMKEYYILEFDYYTELWGIYFPCYELPVFEELTGLKAED